MTQLVQDERKTLVATHVDVDVREQLAALARREDRSLASIIRRALARELERAHHHNPMEEA